MSDSERELFGADPDEGQSPVSEDERMEEYREPVHRPATLKRYAPSHRVEKAYIARVPAFLRCDPQPFDEARFREAHKDNEDVGLEANAVRWRYAGDQTAQKVTRVSNARIVQWSDGSRTLQLGSEHFEIRSHRQGDPAFVCTQDEESGLLSTRQVVDETMTFLPTSTSSATHMLLAKAMARRQESGNVRVGSVETTEDPDKVQRDIEKAESMKDKARRRLAAQRDEVVSYTDRNERAGDERRERDESEEDDDEQEEEAAYSSDASVVDMDDDELEAQGERLQQIKQAKDAEDEDAGEPGERQSSSSAPDAAKSRRMVDDDSD